MNNGSARSGESDPRDVVQTVLERRREFDGAADWDTLIGALAERRRRYLLYHLAEQQCASIEELATAILVLEEEVADRPPVGADRAVVLVSLFHRHVPILEEAGVVTFDQESDVVCRGTRYTDALGLLDGAFERSSEREQ